MVMSEGGFICSTISVLKLTLKYQGVMAIHSERNYVNFCK